LLALHHPAKHNPSDPAGSYPIEGNVDTILGMIDKDNKGNLEMWVKKARDADKSARINLRQQSVDVGNGFGSLVLVPVAEGDRKSTRLNSSHVKISYAVFCLKKKRRTTTRD